MHFFTIKSFMCDSFTQLKNSHSDVKTFKEMTPDHVMLHGVWAELILTILCDA